ncbi:MAG: hypothetical protein H7Y39_01900 [Nitrospiraceae bacterium]|nr:hypothetical protein [Nitrospiraceae bacterium]
MRNAHRRFAEEDLMRAKTDNVDAPGIARFAAQKRPVRTVWDSSTDEVRELVHYHSRLLQDLGNPGYRHSNKFRGIA